MVLNIDGIQKLEGHIFCNRTIKSVQSEVHFSQKVYVFYFDSIATTDSSPFTKWEDAFRVYLYREPKNGAYELFWMGLHGVTCETLDISQIRNFQTFYSYFEKVIRLGKAYWDENKTRS